MRRGGNSDEAAHPIGGLRREHESDVAPRVFNDACYVLNELLHALTEARSRD